MSRVIIICTIPIPMICAGYPKLCYSLVTDDNRGCMAQVTPSLIVLRAYGALGLDPNKWKHFRHHVHFQCAQDSLRWVRPWEGGFICQIPTPSEHNEVMVIFFSLSWKIRTLLTKLLGRFGTGQEADKWSVHHWVKAGKTIPLLMNNTKQLKGRITPDICQLYLQNKVWGGCAAD